MRRSMRGRRRLHKTSTGFSTGGATFRDIALFAEKVRGRCKIKAAGGIRTREDMERFVALGADRLGTSSAIQFLALTRHKGENVVKKLTNAAVFCAIIKFNID